LSSAPNEHAASPRAERLSRIVEMLARTPSVRAELVADIRGRIGDDYMSEEKLDLAIYRMLRDILE
jgi:hypothetical protein